MAINDRKEKKYYCAYHDCWKKDSAIFKCVTIKFCSKYKKSENPVCDHLFVQAKEILT